MCLLHLPIKIGHVPRPCDIRAELIRVLHFFLAKISPGRVRTPNFRLGETIPVSTSNFCRGETSLARARVAVPHFLFFFFANFAQARPSSPRRKHYCNHNYFSKFHHQDNASAFIHLQSRMHRLSLVVQYRLYLEHPL